MLRTFILKVKQIIPKKVENMMTMERVRLTNVLVPKADVANYHKLTILKWQKFIFSQSGGPAVCWKKSEIQGWARLCSLHSS